MISKYKKLERNHAKAVRVLAEITKDWTQYLKEGQSTNDSKNLLSEVMKLNLSWSKNIKQSKKILRQNNIKI